MDPSDEIETLRKRIADLEAEKQSRTQMFQCFQQMMNQFIGTSSSIPISTQRHTDRNVTQLQLGASQPLPRKSQEQKYQAYVQQLAAHMQTTPSSGAKTDLPPTTPEQILTAGHNTASASKQNKQLEPTTAQKQQVQAPIQTTQFNQAHPAVQMQSPISMPSPVSEPSSISTSVPASVMQNQLVNHSRPSQTVSASSHEPQYQIMSPFLFEPVSNISATLQPISVRISNNDKQIHDSSPQSKQMSNSQQTTRQILQSLVSDQPNSEQSTQFNQHGRPGEKRETSTLLCSRKENQKHGNTQHLDESSLKIVMTKSKTQEEQTPMKLNVHDNNLSFGNIFKDKSNILQPQIGQSVTSVEGIILTDDSATNDHHDYNVLGTNEHFQDPPLAQEEREKILAELRKAGLSIIVEKQFQKQEQPENLRINPALIQGSLTPTP